LPDDDGDKRGVRLDSGELVDLSRTVRRILDEAGAADAQIFASGDLNEDRIRELLDAGAPIDAFGVGTEMETSYDAPAVGGVYKLVEDARGYRVKRSAGKATLPGRKQIWRLTRDGEIAEDSSRSTTSRRPAARGGSRCSSRSCTAVGGPPPLSRSPRRVRAAGIGSPRCPRHYERSTAPPIPSDAVRGSMRSFTR
jgi:nicotinate phosphoribosyltransferase